MVRLARSGRQGRSTRSSGPVGGGGGGSSLEYIGSTEQAFAAAGSMTYPAGTQDGDLVIAFGIDRAIGDPAFMSAWADTKLGAGLGGFFHAWAKIVDGETAVAHIGGAGTTIGCHVYRGAAIEDITATFGQFGTTAGFTSSMEFPSVSPAAGQYAGWAFSRTNDTPNALAWTVTPDDSGSITTTSGNDSGTQHAVKAGDGSAFAQQNNGNYTAFFTEGMVYVL